MNSKMADTDLAIFIISLIINELNKNQGAETARMDKKARTKFILSTKDIL